MEDRAFRDRLPEEDDGQGDEKERVTRQLGEEVRHLRDRLQATVEEYETSNEELKAANEELQSINEEYRSTTEELETSKEELQSVNEELETVNNELKNKLEEISRAHSDLQNLMVATEIATLFLDRDLRVQSYTDRVEEIFNIMKTDRGRPIGHLTHRLTYPELSNDARMVIRTLVPLEREVERNDGKAWYLARLRPYRTVDDRIEGVVLTLVNVTHMKETEQALRRANRLLDLSLGAAGTGWSTWNAGTGHGENDDRIRELLGYPADGSHLTMADWLDRVHPEDRPALEAAMQTVAENGGKLETEFRVVLPSGETRYVQSAGVFVSDQDDNGPFWTGLMRDVTDRVLLNQSLEEARENLQQALWSADLGWGIADIQTGQLEQDFRAREMVGFPPDKPLTVPDYIALVHPDDRPLVEANYKGWADGKLESTGEYRVIRPDGQERIIRATGRLRRDAFGNPWQIIGTLQDVTKRRRDGAELLRLTEELEELVAERTAELQHANTELAAARDRFQMVFDANPTPKVIIDLDDGTYVEANPAFLEYMGLEREQVVGHRAEETVFRQPTFANLEAVEEEFERDGRMRSAEATFEIRPGDVRTALISAVRILLDGRERVLATVTDITDHKQAEQQIRELASELTRAEEQERRRVSSILHDDLQQRLYSIQIELIQLRDRLDKNDAEGLMKLLDKMDALLPETITIARDLSIDLNPPILDDDGIAEALQWLATKMSRQYGLPVRVNTDESFPLSDRGLRIVLFHVVRELLFNVVKHANGTQIEITLTRDNGNLRVEVTDDGRGFDARQLQTTKEGNGLTMARQRLGLFGGNMDIDSAPEAGTRVVILVPLSSNADDE
jgi:PAS domain S-box-containing protein